MNANEACPFKVMKKCLLAMLILVIPMLILMLLTLNTDYADTDLSIRIINVIVVYHVYIKIHKLLN